MSSTRIQGSALSLTFGGVDYWADVTGARLTNAPDSVTVRDWHGAPVHTNYKYTLKGSAIQSLDTDSFWRYAWHNSGTRINFRYAPLGNHEPTPDRPHLVGVVQVGAPPTLGGNAGTGEYAFDFEWEVIGKPDLDDGTSPES